MKIFLATSYTAKIDKNGIVEVSYQNQIKSLLSCLEQDGSTAYCAPREDNWQINHNDPVDAFKLDTEKIQDCDLMVAFVELNPPSAGVQFELGLSFALKKPVVLIHHVDDKLPYMNIGFVDSERVSEITFQNPSEIVPQLESVLDKIA